jgi:hypothetical protein
MRLSDYLLLPGYFLRRGGRKAADSHYLLVLAPRVRPGPAAL